MNCKAYRNEFEESELNAGVSATASRHLEACAACRDFSRERNALRSLCGSLGSVAAPADFDFRLRARIRAAEAAPRPALFARLLTPSASAALAACFVLALTAAIYFRQPAPASPNEGVSSASVDSRSGAEATTAKDENKGAIANQNKENEATTAQSDAAVQIVTTSNPIERADGNETNRVKRVRGERKNDFASMPADIIKRRGSDEGEIARLTAPVPVSLPSSNQTLKVVLRDERGASRVVSMRPVSFGSQQLVGQMGNSFRASSVAKEGVW